MTITKPTALVTGASRGIGAAIAKRLAKDGYHVFVNYVASEAKAQEIVKEIEAAGGSAEALQFDVASETQIEEKFEWISKNRPPLSVLVNNAGITYDQLLLRVKDSEIDRVFGVDLKGAIHTTRLAFKQMMKARKGSIIQISSVIGEMGNAGQSVYAAAKAGLLGFTKSAAKEFAPRNIRVNAVTPGFIETEMTGALTPEQKEAILRGVPLGYYGNPEDVSSLVSFLASDQSRYITGQVIGVNGGLYI